MPLKFEFKYEGGLEINFDKLLEKPMTATMNKTVSIIRMHFDKNQSKWRPLSPATIAERIALGFGPGPKLVRTGDLRDKEAVENTELESGNRGFRISTDSQKAYEQDTILNRPFYDMDDQDITVITRTLAETILEAWERGSL